MDKLITGKERSKVCEWEGGVGEMEIVKMHMWKVGVDVCHYELIKIDLGMMVTIQREGVATFKEENRKRN